MSDVTPRRSGRSRKSNARYTTTIYLDSDDSEAAANPPSEQDDEEDDAFQIDEAIVAQEETEDEAAGSEDDTDGNASADEAEIVAVEEQDDESVYGSQVEDVAGRSKAGRSAPRVPGADPSFTASLPSFDPRAQQAAGKHKVSSRGMVEVIKRGTKGDRIKTHFGPSDQDLIPYIQGRDKWSAASTLPSRHADKADAGGMAPSFYHSAEMQRRERTEGWKWYTHDGGRQAFSRLQTVRPLSSVEARLYVKHLQNAPQRFLVGPQSRQKLVDLPVESSTTVQEPFQSDDDLKKSSAARNSADASPKGWIVNAGARISCLEWVPNRDDATQYLGVAVLEQDPAEASTAAADKVETKSAPAWSSREHPASIQLWQVSASDSPESSGKLDVALPPKLDTVFCFDWGDVKQFKWCPMPAPELKKSSESSRRRLGLLAGVWSDGSVRVLDVELPIHGGPDPQYHLMAKSAFKSTFPDTVPTCITWLSTTSIAVGCANGFVAIWNLAKHIMSKSQEANTRPWFYSQLQATYVLSIISSYPSRPHIITTTSMDGVMKITDLRAPYMDSFTVTRSRMASSTICWHELTQTVLLCDETGVLRGHPIRIPYSAIELMNMSAGVSDIATSPVHSALLVAQNDGAAVCTQIFERMTATRANIYRQIWFQYTWRRAIDSAPQAAADGDDDDEAMVDVVSAEGALPDASSSDAIASKDLNPLLKEPLGRFLEGQKIDRVGGVNVDIYKDMAWYLTIYEAQTNICRVAWNPNLNYGGWAAAGTGSGLIRIDDLAI